ncbi:MAG: shikimate kinase [Actinomycetota bacterium]
MGADPAARKSALILIGPSGAGKSEIGRRLAEALGRPLVDTDALVEKRHGRSVSRIFAEETESGFRVKESEAVVEATAVEGAVIACGGGVVLDPENVERLRAAGEVVYLKASPEVAAERLGDGADRPLLEGTELGEQIAKLIEQRHGLYVNAADHVVDADGRPEDVVDKLAKIWDSVSGPRVAFSLKSEPEEEP